MVNTFYVLTAIQSVKFITSHGLVYNASIVKNVLINNYGQWRCDIMSKDMSGTDKLIFISSFIWTLHWGSCLVLKLSDTVIANTSVRILPLGL